MTQPHVTASTVVSIIALLVVILTAVVGHIVMTESRLATLEEQFRQCVAETRTP